MRSRHPQNDARYEWTHHVIEKMRYYGLSEGRVRRVIHSPKRVEEGIAPGTIAVMQPSAGLTQKYEVWVMYQMLGGKKQESRIKNRGKVDQRIAFLPVKKRIITAWKYPGVSKPREKPPIPDEILAELVGEFL